MKIGDHVSFQAGLDRHIEFGELVDVDPKEETGTIRVGKSFHKRALGRIRSFVRGMKEQESKRSETVATWIGSVGDRLR